jgi:hypothetical protein
MSTVTETVAGVKAPAKEGWRHSRDTQFKTQGILFLGLRPDPREASLLCRPGDVPR